MQEPNPGASPEDLSAPALMIEQEVASLLRVAPNTLTGWRSKSRNQGPPWFKLGGRVVYRRDEVLHWLEAQRQKAVREGRSA